MTSTAPREVNIEQVGAIYAGFMHEVKLRLGAIDSALQRIAEDGASEAAFLDAEFCYLQARMTCEIIALAALVAHNEMPDANTRALLKNWNADSIFDRLTSVNANCYPVPLKVVIAGDGGRHLKPVDEPFLTRADLKKMYHECGENLHRGVLIHVLEGRRKAYDMQPLRQWLESVLQLLEQHAVLLPQLNAALLVQMSDEHGEVSCSRLVGLSGDSFTVAAGGSE